MKLSEDDSDGVEKTNRWATKMDNQYVPAISFRKTNRGLKMALVIATVLFIITLLAFMVLIVRYNSISKQSNELENICLTPECIRSASTLLQSMNVSVDPCDDFYDYVCGRWHKDHYIPPDGLNVDWFSERTRIVVEMVKEFLEMNSTSTESLPVIHARSMYKACTDTELINELGIEPLQFVLEEMSLPKYPPLEVDDYEKYVGTELNLSRLLAKMKMVIGESLLFSVSVMPDPKNNSYNLLAVMATDQQAELAHGKKKMLQKNLENLIDREDQVAVTNILSEFNRFVIKYFLNSMENGTDISDSEIKDAAKKITDLEKKILLAKDNKNTTQKAGHPIYMNISQLQATIDEAVEKSGTGGMVHIQWYEFMNEMLNYSSVSVNLEEQEILVYNIEYLKDIVKLLSRYSEHEILLYLWTESIYSMAPYANDDIRNARYHLLQAYGEPENKPRKSYCADLVWHKLDHALAIGFTDGVDINSIRRDVNKMLDNILYALKNSVMESDWIDQKTKLAIIEKAESVHRNIGIPDWIMNSTLIENYYEGYNFSESTHLMNFLLTKQILEANTINLLTQTNVVDTGMVILDPLEVNAAYSPVDNAIAVNINILQFPFYNLGLDSMNYGTLGSTLGHEMMHAFDSEGRKYDKHGNVKNWWTEETTNNYLKRISCFIDHYHKYYIPELEEFLDGNITLAENLADNGGIKDSFYAYQKLKQDKQFKELLLPGLQDYSGDQLFYMSYAHYYCENWTPTSMKLLKDDEHSPNKYRVLGALSNSKEFGKTWNCPAGSKMNPTKKCTLW